VFVRRAQASAEVGAKDIFAPVADLMVAVVFIFIILTLALSLNLSNEETVPRSSYEAKVAEIEELKRQLAASQIRIAELEEKNTKLVEFVRFIRDSRVMPLMERLSQADQTRAVILSDMRARLSALGVDVKINPDAGTLSLPSNRLFASGQADPTMPEGRDTILRLGQVMSEVLPCYSPQAPQKGCSAKGEFSDLSAVYIEGHTDVVPYGAGTARFRNNWDLSAGRAIEAYTVVRDRFQRLRDLRNQQGEAMLGVSGYADTRPAVGDDADRSQPSVTERDRRIEVRIIMSTNEQVVGSVLRELNNRLEAVDELAR
jgi:flagellar motor protein MotB